MDSGIFRPTVPLPLFVGLSLVNIIAEYGDNGESCLKHLKELKDIGNSVLLIFVRGAGAMVIMPGDDMEPLAQPDLRLWAAEYIPGYCAFLEYGGMRLAR